VPERRPTPFGFLSNIDVREQEPPRAKTMLATSGIAHGKATLASTNKISIATGSRNPVIVRVAFSAK
jgi:hypothetical protein